MTLQVDVPMGSAVLTVAANDTFALLKNRADYVCDGTDDHVEIQAALDALPAAGGEVLLLEGTYYIEVNLALDSNQTLRGCGKNTILTTTTADLDIIKATGGDGTEKTGILIADLCIDGNAGGVTDDKAIMWVYVDHSKIQNVWLQDNGEEGIYLEYCDFNEIIGNSSRGNRYHGIRLNYSADNVVVGNISSENIANGQGIYLYKAPRNTIADNCCQGNLQYGIRMDSQSILNIVSGNICHGNTYEGIHIECDSNRCTVVGNICTGSLAGAGIQIKDALDIVIVGNQCEGNNVHGIHVLRSSYCTVAGNICKNQTTGDGINVTGDGTLPSDYNSITGNICYNNGDDGIEIAGGTDANHNIVQGNLLVGNSGTALVDAGTLTHVQGNVGSEITDEKVYEYVKNTSGGDLAVGDVVVLKAVAAGNEITTTTTEGDQMVFGMVAETIVDTAYGWVQVSGKTTALKVDGTTDIAIGDLIGCFTTAKIGMKAASGKMAFAIALEGYTTNDSNGVIDALIIKPRQAV